MCMNYSYLLDGNKDCNYFDSSLRPWTSFFLFSFLLILAVFRFNHHLRCCFSCTGRYDFPFPTSLSLSLSLSLFLFFISLCLPLPVFFPVYLSPSFPPTLSSSLSNIMCVHVHTHICTCEPYVPVSDGEPLLSHLDIAIESIIVKWSNHQFRPIMMIIKP